MKIYIARHGQTIWNTEHRMQGWQDSNLSPKGIEDAKKLGASLKDINFDSMFSSPLGRAFDTAKYVRGDRKAEIITIDSFKEMNFGKWEGMSDSDVREQYPEEHHNFWKQPHLFKPIEGESFDVLAARVKKGFDSLIQRTIVDNENVLLVTHTCVIKTILSLLNNYPINDFWNPPYIHATSLTVLNVDEKEIKTVMVADTSHLDSV